MTNEQFWKELDKLAVTECDEISVLKFAALLMEGYLKGLDMFEIALVDSYDESTINQLYSGTFDKRLMLCCTTMKKGKHDVYEMEKNGTLSSGTKVCVAAVPCKQILDNLYYKNEIAALVFNIHSGNPFIVPAELLREMIGKTGMQRLPENYTPADPVRFKSNGSKKKEIPIKEWAAKKCPPAYLVLLLDEPTNHLDIESIQWLEQFLNLSSSSVVLVSHDRAFINNVSNRTLEISCGHVIDYKVKYDDYVVLRKDRREQQFRAYENQQKEIAEMKDFIERFRYKATKAVQVQQKLKQLEKIVPIEIDEIDNLAMHLKFPPCMRSGDYPVVCDEVRKSYAHVVFDHVNLTIKRGEKVAFVGKNGEGKSTLVKCIMGEIPFDGNLKVGHNVQIGYFAQNQAQLLDESLTVFQTIDNVAKGDVRMRINDILGAFMFGGENSDKKVKVLSGGERSRLAMIRLLLEPVNLLILDEPTNHLDMASKDVLKEAIRAFDGTVILVSHDREFLDGLVTKVYEFGGGKVREHLGGIYDFLHSRKIQELSELEKSKAVPAMPQPTTLASSPNKQSYAEHKEQQKQLRKAERAVEESEKKIVKMEQRLKELDELLMVDRKSVV